MRLPPKFVARSFLVAALAVALYLAFILVLGWDNIRDQVREFPASLLLVMALLSLVNYFLRFIRWEIYLRNLGCPLPLANSLIIYFAAYVMVITPGKIGEVFKAGILREDHDIPLSKGIPVVLAERIYDFLAVLLLAWAGVFFWPGPFSGIKVGLVTAAGIPLGLFALQNSRLRALLLAKLAKAPILQKHSLALDESLQSLGSLLRPSQMALSIPLTVVAWLGECLGLWLACRGLGLPVPVPEATFVYAAGTLVGSLSFLPGGLGGTEATIVFLLQSLGTTTAAAATVALLVRLFTLWLAVVVGLFFVFPLKLHRR